MKRFFFVKAVTYHVVEADDEHDALEKTRTFHEHDACGSRGVVGSAEGEDRLTVFHAWRDRKIRETGTVP